MPWSEFWPDFQRRYRMTRGDAQHVTLLGPPRTGKSHLAGIIAGERPYVFALMSKPKDEPMRRLLAAHGYRRVPALCEASIAPRQALWPKYRGVADAVQQRAVFAAALDDGFAAGGWHCLADEGHYLAHRLRLEAHLRSWLQQGPSNGNGLILCAQRPAWLPRDIYSARHLFFFGTNDGQDLRSIGGMNGAADDTVRSVVAGLGRTYRFLHVDTHDGTMTVSRYEP